MYGVIERNKLTFEKQVYGVTKRTKVKFEKQVYGVTERKHFTFEQVYGVINLKNLRLKNKCTVL